MDKQHLKFKKGDLIYHKVNHSIIGIVEDISRTTYKILYIDVDVKDSGAGPIANDFKWCETNYNLLTDIFRGYLTT